MKRMAKELQASNTMRAKLASLLEVERERTVGLTAEVDALREALEDALESQEQLMGHIVHWRQSDQDALRARIDANKAVLAKSRTQVVS